MKQECIKSGELRVTGRLVDASNATLFAEVVGEVSDLEVIYKPIAGERPLWDFPDGNLASREVAAYLISEALGYGLVPYTIMRDGPYGPGSVQEWIAIDEDADVLEHAQSEHHKIRQMSLFDAIINNTDRKFGHILIKSPEEIYACDHGVTFHVEDKLRTVIWQFAGEALTEDELATLKSLKNRLDRIPLAELLTVAEIRQIEVRIDRLIQAGIFPLPRDGWPSVPWPPY